MRRSRTGALSAYRVVPVLLIVSCLGWGQASNPTDQETISQLAEQVKQLRQHDREMQERIKALEAVQKGAPTADTPTPDSSATDTPALAAPATTPGVPEVPALALPEMHTLSGIQWRGFAEVNYKVLDHRAPETGTYGFVPGSAGNFYTGDFDLFLNSRLTNKSSVLAEIAFKEGDAQGFSVDLRRLLLKYDFNDHLKLSVGRYQTSIGYYNWAFRSAAWLQTTADRPLVMEFASEGGLLPTQAVGVSVTGSIPSGKLGLNYIAEYGSSDTIRPHVNGDGLVSDENNSNQVNVGLFLRPDSVRGLQIGASVYHDQISDLVYPLHSSYTGPPQEGDPSARWGQTIVNGYVVYVAKGVEFLNEGFLIRHALIGGTGPLNTPAFYSQFSKKFGPIRPFVRYQYVNASPRNQFYDDTGLRYGPSFGARYDMNDYFAFKAQLDHTARRGLPNLNGLHLQLAVTF